MHGVACLDRLQLNCPSWDQLSCLNLLSVNPVAENKVDDPMPAVSVSNLLNPLYCSSDDMWCG